jgi:hypothetical protein
MSSPFLAPSDWTQTSAMTWVETANTTWQPQRATFNNPVRASVYWTTQTASTTVPQQWQVLGLQWQTGTSISSNYYQYSGVGWLEAQPERIVEAEVRISTALFEDHPDPDALLGEQMEELRRQLEEAVGVTITRESVWEEWCTGDVMNADEVVLKAQWTPRALTIEAWDAWQNLPKMRRVWDQATRRYTEIDEAEFKRRAWKSAQHSLIIRNRGRATQLRDRIAQRRARELLLSMLDEVQAQQWESERAFTIETADGARRYRIRHGVAGNIMLVKDGDREAPPDGWLRRFCFHAYHPDGSMPVEDHVLAQKLYIEADEESFLQLANPA